MRGLARPEYEAFDLGIIREVMESNFYRLPPSLTGTIVDIGAHIGAFSFACLNRGATKVLAYEPEPLNYAALVGNIGRFCNNKSPYPPKIIAHEAAVWRSDVPRGARLSMGRFDRHNPKANTGGVSVAEVFESDFFVSTVPLDDILTEPVRVLKLDCEGSEYPILLTATKLSMVQSIRLEYHDKPLRPEAGVPPSVGALCEKLTAEGFTVTVVPIWKTAGLLIAERGV